MSGAEVPTTPKPELQNGSNSSQELTTKSEETAKGQVGTKNNQVSGTEVPTTPKPEAQNGSNSSQELTTQREETAEGQRVNQEEKNTFNNLNENKVNKATNEEQNSITLKTGTEGNEAMMSDGTRNNVDNNIIRKYKSDTAMAATIKDLKQLKDKEELSCCNSLS